MTLAEKDAVITKLFSALSAPVDLVDIFDAAVDAVQAEFHSEEGMSQESISMTRFES